MRRKKIGFDTLFIVLGTCLLVGLGAVILYNFFNDSRLIRSNPVVEQATATVTYSPTSADSPSPTTTPTVAQAKIRVQVINYTGITGLAEATKTTLESAGFEVSCGNETSLKAVKSSVSEKPEVNAFSQISKILNMPVRSATHSESSARFDVIVILGDDYRP